MRRSDVVGRAQFASGERNANFICPAQCPFDLPAASQLARFSRHRHVGDRQRERGADVLPNHEVLAVEVDQMQF
jgi:hypothetical protein